MSPERTKKTTSAAELYLRGHAFRHQILTTSLFLNNKAESTSLLANISGFCHYHGSHDQILEATDSDGRADCEHV